MACVQHVAELLFLEKVNMGSFMGAQIILPVNLPKENNGISLKIVGV